MHICNYSFYIHVFSYVLTQIYCRWTFLMHCTTRWIYYCWGSRTILLLNMAVHYMIVKTTKPKFIRVSVASEVCRVQIKSAVKRSLYRNWGTNQFVLLVSIWHDDIRVFYIYNYKIEFPEKGIMKISYWNLREEVNHVFKPFVKEDTYLIE